MKKLIYIVLFLLPLITQGQSQSVTLQFRSFGERYPIYTWSGIPSGGYDTLWNAAKIRNYTQNKLSAYGLLAGNNTWTGNNQFGSLHLTGNLTVDGTITTPTLIANFRTLDAGSGVLDILGNQIQSANSNIVLAGGIQFNEMNGSTFKFKSGGNEIVTFGDGTANNATFNVPVAITSMPDYTSDYTSGNAKLVVRDNNTYLGTINASAVVPDSALKPNKNLYDVTNKATARLNLYAQRATFISALDFVTDTTGTINVSTGLQNAINATPNGGTLWIPRGKYLASGLIVNKTISIRGDNGMLTFNNPTSTQIDTTAGTTIISPSATQAVFTMNRPGSNFRDIAIMSKRNVTPTTSYGVYWANAGYMQMERMTIAGFNTNVYFNNGNFAMFYNIVFENPLTANLVIESPTNPDIGDNKIIGCEFSGYNTTSKDIIFHSSGGLYISSSKFVIRGGGVKGSVIDVSMQGSTADINFTHNSVEGFNGTFFKVRRNGYQLNNVQISNNQVTPTGAISGSLIDIVGAGQTQITNNILTGSPSVGGTFIVALDSVANPMVRNNIIPYGFRLSVAHATGIVDTASYNNNIALKNANNAFIGNNTLTGITRIQNGTALGSQIGGADVNASTRTNSTRQLYRIVSTDFSTTGNDVSLINADNDGTNHNVNLGYTPSGSNKAATRVSIGVVNSLTATAGTEVVGVDTRGIILSRVQAGVAGTDSLVTHISGGLLKTISPNYYMANPMTTLGDVIYGGASGAPTRLAGNTTTSRRFLTSLGNGTVSTAPTFYDLYNTNATWNSVPTFTFGVVLGGNTPVNYNFGTFSTNFGANTSTANRIINLPDANGTVALTSDIDKFLRLTGSGTGAATTISFPHGQTGVTAASIAVVTPINAASSGISFVTCDSVNLNVTWATAPVSGTNNISLNVFLKP